MKHTKALAYAKKYKLPTLAGTDAHGFEVCHSGVALKEKAEDIKKFIEIIKAGEYELIKPR